MAWWDARKQRQGGSASAADADALASAPISAVGPVAFSTASSASSTLSASVPNCHHCKPESNQFPLKRRTSLGDVSSRFAPEPVPRSTNNNMTMDQRPQLLSPVFEEQSAPPPTTPALIVHVDIKFADPDIHSRYSRSYGSSPAFAPTARMRNGLLRRIDRCARELITRKDSAALDMINDASLERKPLRFETTFRITTRDGGDWAQRTYRSYQKQPLTVANTKDIILASHRIVGLFLRKHDEGFLWMDGAVRDTDEDGPETTTGGPPSLLCVPSSRFLESSQSFESVPGYTVEVSFRSRNSQRDVPLFAKTVRINSAQAAPLTVFTSEDVLWRGLQAINQNLERRKQVFDGHVKNCRSSHCQHSDDKSLLVELRVANNLGPVFPHVQRTVESKLLLFRDQDSRDCDEFLRDIETTLADVRHDTDAKLGGLNDFEFTIVELRGSGWSTRRPAEFSIGPSASFGRRTIQAVLDRIQTGIADVLRGHDVAIHISSHKRGHLILDKAIVAHAKHGPKESFASPEEEQATFVSRLKMRIQQDIDMVFEDTCTIDDIADEEVEQRPFSRLAALCANADSPTETVSSRGKSVASEPERRPTTPIRDSAKGLSPAQRPATPITNSAKRREQERPTTPIRDSLKRRVQRAFSLTSRRSPRRDTDSVGSMGSTNSYKPSEDAYEADSSIATSVAGDEPSEKGSPVQTKERASSITMSPFRKIQRKFPLLSRRHSARVSSASSTLFEEFPGGLGDMETGAASRDGRQEEAAEASATTSSAAHPLEGTASQVAGDALISVTTVEADFDGANARARMNPVTSPRITSTPGLVCNPKLRSAHSQPGILRPLMESPMDSPALAPFEDAQEFSSSVVDAESLAVPKPDPSYSISQTASPAPEEYSTAPSTPGLSTGGDPSPRNSLLITPTYTRKLSGLRDSVFDVDTETNTTPMEVLTPDVGGMPAYQAPKDDLQLATTPLVGLGPAPEFVPATTTTPESPVEVSPTDTAPPTHHSTLSTSSLRASAPSFAPSFMSASLSATAPTFVPSQGFVPVTELAAAPQPASQPTPAPSGANFAAAAAPTWAKIAATKPKKAHVQPAAAQPPKGVDSDADNKTSESKSSQNAEKKEQDKVNKVPEVETEDSAPPTVTEELQGGKADQELPRTVVTEKEDGSEVDLETPTLEAAGKDAVSPAEFVQEEKSEIEKDPAEQKNDVAEDSPAEEEQAAADVDIVEEVEILEEKPEVVEESAKEEEAKQVDAEKEDVVEVTEQDIVEQDGLTERSEEPEHVVIEETVKKPQQPTEKISGQTHVFVWASPSESEIAEESYTEQDDVELDDIEPDDVEETSLLEESGGLHHIAAEQPVKRPDHAVEKISGLTHVFVWASTPKNKPVEERSSGLKHVFVWAGSDSQQQLPKSCTLIVAAEDSKTDTVEPVEEVATGVHEQVEEEAFPEPATEQAGIGHKVLQQPTGEDQTSGPEDAAANPEPLSEQDSEESGEQAEDVTASEVESAAQLETETRVKEAPSVEARAGSLRKAVKDTNEGGVQADSGSEPENTEPDLSDDQSTQAPVISAQDFAPSANDDASPSKDASASSPTTSEDTSTPTVTKLDSFKPTFLAPSPALSVRSSISSFAEWPDYEHAMADLSRGSVDTIRVSSDIPAYAEPEPPHSRPQTAGYLGLGLGGVDMGFRGALGSRRLSLPLQNIFIAAGQKHGHGEVDPKSQATTAVGTPESSVAGDDASAPSKPKKRRVYEQKVIGEVKYREKEEAGLILADEERPSVLPRMMMLLAGVVAVGKALKKPSVY